MAAHKNVPSVSESRVLGCLFGLAVGDALGLATENLSRKAIAKRFGPVDRYALFPGRAWVSDDTEQAMALAASLAARGGFDARDFGRRLRNWFASLPAFIGLATIRACLKLAIGVSGERSGVNSAGNGASMRVPPLGLFYAARPRELAGAAAKSTLVTHTHPRAIAGTLAVATATAELAAMPAGGLNPSDFVAKVAEAAAAHDQPMAEAIRNVLQPDASLETIGTTGYVLHTVPAALYCFLRSPDSFRDSVSLAAGGGGDTDTIAAITGALSGAYNGIEAIPREWLEPLERAPGAGRAAYIRAVAAALMQASRTGSPQRVPSLSAFSVIRARLEFLALLPVQLLLRLFWALAPARRPRS